MKACAPGSSAAGCRVTALDEALAEEAGDDSSRGPKQADLLIELAQEAELFHSPDATAFADLVVNGHRETWPVRTKGFRRWLARRFFEATGGAPNSEALQSALNVIEAKAHFDGPEREVHIRIGGLGDKLYLDLGDEAWRAVEIDSDGWRVVDEPPVRFRRAAGMQALPTPQPGGSIETLRRFLNVQGDNDFILVVAWALAVLRNRGPYPVIVLSGEQGSAKSTFSAVLRSLLDPNTAPLRALPREDRDLFIAANNGHVLAFDNVSGLPAWISDTLCRLATGGGFAVRQLYTDQDEVLFDAARPVILNGIEDIVTRPDLADRAIFLTLEAIPEERRRPEKELWAEFNAARPQLLGTLLDAVSHGLKQIAGYPARQPAAHGGFRTLGHGLRDRAMAGRHLRRRLCGQPRRGRRQRHRGRSGGLCHPFADRYADRVDGNRLGPSGRPRRGGRGEGAQVQGLAIVGPGLVGARPPGSDLPAQGRHRHHLRARGPRQDPHHPDYPQAGIVLRQDRPYRPHRPRRRQKPGITTASMKTTRGRSAGARTQTPVAPNLGPSATTTPKTMRWPLRTVRTQVRRPIPAGWRTRL